MLTQEQEYVRAKRDMLHSMLVEVSRTIDYCQEFLAKWRAAGTSYGTERAMRCKRELLALYFSGWQIHAEMHLLDHVMDEAGAAEFIQAQLLN